MALLCPLSLYLNYSVISPPDGNSCFMFYFWTFFFFFLRLSFRLYSLWVQCTRCSFGCNIRLFLASVYQYTALVCSLFCPLCIEQYQSVWACVWVSECVCVSPLQERSQILLQFSHFSIYLQWLSLCNSECIFVHWIWIYIYIYMIIYVWNMKMAWVYCFDNTCCCWNDMNLCCRW